MMEISSRTRKKAKHKGIITSQSLKPESHSTSGLGSFFSVASDTARSASVASPKSSGDELCWSGDADRGELLEVIVDSRDSVRSSLGKVVMEVDVGLGQEK
jgi:hypothetical protein